MTKAEMSPYPTLSKMGVQSPRQIDNYYITSMNYVDVLRIVYERPKGSFLPSSRTYKFPRVQDNPVAGAEKKAVVMRIHPTLVAALDELEKILKAKSSKESIAAEILREVGLLEEDIAMRSECLKMLANRIPTVE